MGLLVFLGTKKPLFSHRGFCVDDGCSDCENFISFLAAFHLGKHAYIFLKMEKWIERNKLSFVPKRDLKTSQQSPEKIQTISFIQVITSLVIPNYFEC